MSGRREGADLVLRGGRVWTGLATPIDLTVAGGRVVFERKGHAD